MRKEPTQEYLKECFDYVDGELIWKVRPREHFDSDRSWKRCNNMYSGKLAGCKHYDINVDGYHYKIGINGTQYLRSRLTFIYNNGAIPEGLQIDHISGDTENDHIRNLRAVNQQVNLYNKKRYKSNSSGVAGVHWDEAGKRWRAQANINGKVKRIYSGPDFFEAVCARKSWESKNTNITSRHGK